MKNLYLLLALFASAQAYSAELNDSIIILPGGGSGNGKIPKPHKSPNHSSSVCNYDATRMSLIFDLPSCADIQFAIYNSMDEFICTGSASPEEPLPLKALPADTYTIYISQEDNTYLYYFTNLLKTQSL